MSDKYLKSLTFPDLADRYVVGDSSLSVSGAAADAKTTGDALATKAEVDGAYEAMTVGNAEQLVGTTFEEDSVPYNFRTSGGSIDIGDREYDELVGGTVAWNQLIPISGIDSTVTVKGVTFTNNGDGTVTINGTATDTISGNDYRAISPQSVISGHKYLFRGCPSGGSRTTYFVYDGYQLRDTGNGTVAVPQLLRCVFYAASGTVFNNVKFVPQIFDLTAMFGSTIADYIYSLEQATAGAGVAWFKKLFPKPYYAYNAGQLMSVKALRHITRGFNAWDGLFSEQGKYITTDGELAASTLWNITSYIKVVPNTVYHFHNLSIGTSAKMAWYDADKNFISTSNIPQADFNETSPANAAYVRCSVNTSETETCINLSWDGERDGEYEEYAEHVYELDPDLELRGIPKLTAGNDLYYDGDVYEPDGTVTRKYGVVDLGSLTWSKISTTGDHWRFYATYDDAKAVTNAVTGNLMCEKYEATTALESYGGQRGVAVQPNGTHTVLMVVDENYSDQTAFKTAMDGVYLVYELATPTTEEADPYQNPQIVDDFGTEEYVDAGVTASTPTRDVAIPVGHNTKYQPNLRAKLEMLPNSPDGDGDYLMRQSNGENSFVPFVKELPTLPSEDGTYVLKCTVSGSTKALGWVEEE